MPAIIQGTDSLNAQTSEKILRCECSNPSWVGDEFIRKGLEEARPSGKSRDRAECVGQCAKVQQSPEPRHTVCDPCVCRGPLHTVQDEQKKDARLTEEPIRFLQKCQGSMTVRSYEKTPRCLRAAGRFFYYLVWLFSRRKRSGGMVVQRTGIPQKRRLWWLSRRIRKTPYALPLVPSVKMESLLRVSRDNRGKIFFRTEPRSISEIPNFVKMPILYGVK